MPRSARADHPGALQHVMARGIERRRIFLDDEDRERFLARLGRIVAETGTRCFAFATMPNHYHLLLGIRSTPLSKVMARLGTAHGMGFNRRHDRVGHLFQNRYKSNLVKDDAGLLTLVRYIHLNPVKAGLVPSVEALADYPWTGHATLMGRRQATFLDAKFVLDQFGWEPLEARRGLLRWMRKESGDDLSLEEVYERPAPSGPAPDPGVIERDLFPEILRKRRLREGGWDPARVRSAVCDHLGIDPELLRSGRRSRAASRAREAIAALVVDVLGRSHVEAARAVGACRQGAERALGRFANWPEQRRSEILALLPPE
jgi:putative transposase